MKRTVALGIFLALLLLHGCGAPTHFLAVTGDCDTTAIAGKWNAKIPLQKAVASANPRAQTFDLLLLGGDGLAANISSENLAGCYLTYSKENHWEARCEGWPPSANIKNLAKIAVISTAEDAQAVRFLANNKQRRLSAGQLLLQGSRVLHEEGASKKNGRAVTVYTSRWQLPLSKLLPAANQFCAVANDGETVYWRDWNCRLETRENQIDLLYGNQRLENLAGIMADPPTFSIAEVYRDALHFLEQNKRVMIIELDGWGWAMQQRAGKAYAPFLSSLQARRALACFPPISPVGLASMLTGQTPEGHGIHDRENRGMKAEDLFQAAQKLGKTSAYVEGKHALIQTSLAPVLSLGDEKTYQNASLALQKQPDLLFVHFHEIDDNAHAHGPYAKQTLRQIQAVDGYVRKLMDQFPGRVIITADHGLHQTTQGGAHGSFAAQDMLVPYIIR
jgi:hypothetical protein